jgi:hypothetical protein
MSRLRRLLLPLGLTATLGGGAAATAFYVRDTRVATRRAELEAERAAAEAQAHELEQGNVALRAQAERLQRERESDVGVVTTLWDERDRRINDGSHRAADSIYAAPEALSVLAGLQQHFEYFGRRARDFFGFDMNAARIHTLGLAVAAATHDAQRHGVAQSLQHLRLFDADPFIQSLVHYVEADGALRGMRAAMSARTGGLGGTSYATTTYQRSYVRSNHLQGQHELQQHQQSASSSSGGSSAVDKDMPRSLAELSAIFVSERAAFESVVNAVAQCAREEQKRRVEAQAVCAGSFGAFLALRSLRAARVATDGATPAAAAASAADAAAAEARAAWELRDDKDCFAAIRHVDALGQTYTAALAADEPWARDGDVAVSLRRLRVWAAAAERFLSEQLMIEALGAFATIMHHSASFVDKRPSEVVLAEYRETGPQLSLA